MDTITISTALLDAIIDEAQDIPLPDMVSKEEVELRLKATEMLIEHYERKKARLSRFTTNTGED